MNSRQKIKEKFQGYINEIDKLKLSIDFNRDREASEKAIKDMIAILNKCYPLAGYISARFQEDLLLNSRKFEHSYYIGVDAWPYFDTCVSTVDKLINIIETENEFGDLIPAQKYYVKNQKFSILADLDSIFRNATAELTYYDPYMDHVLLEAVSDLEIPSINLVLLNPSEKFKLFVNELNKERGMNVRYFEFENKEIHDRYCLIDGNELWQISGTINVKNLNSITLTKIVDEESQKKIIDDLNKILNI